MRGQSSELRVVRSGQPSLNIQRAYFIEQGCSAEIVQMGSDIVEQEDRRHVSVLRD